MATRIQNDTSEQLAAIMIIVGALARKAKISLQDVQAFADHAANVLHEDDTPAVRQRVAGMLQTYDAIVKDYAKKR